MQTHQKIKLDANEVGISNFSDSRMIRIYAKTIPTNMHSEYHVIKKGPILIAILLILSFAPFNKRFYNESFHYNICNTYKYRNHKW